MSTRLEGGSLDENAEGEKPSPTPTTSSSVDPSLFRAMPVHWGDEDPRTFPTLADFPPYYRLPFTLSFAVGCGTTCSASTGRPSSLRTTLHALTGTSKTTKQWSSKYLAV